MASGAVQPRPGLHILVVDDDNLLRGLVCRMLVAEGMDVIEARDGHEALRLATEQAFDAVLIDRHMPGLDGLSALPVLRELLPEARLVLFTSVVTIDLRDRALSIGASAVVEKAEGLDSLLAALQ